MVTAVDICNSALSYVGERDRVTAIAPPDGSEEARHCARAYEEAFAELLEMHAWNFLVRKVQLTAVNADADDTDDPAWAFRYELPDDCNEVLAVLPDEHSADYVVNGTPVTLDFHIKLPADDDEVEANGMTLYCNEEDVWVRYTMNTVELAHVSRLFIAALTWLIAAKIAGTIVRGDSGEMMKNRCLQMFARYLAEARTKDSRQRQVEKTVTPEWMRGRQDWTDQSHPFRSL
jgi:hypothetical protein